MRKPREQDIVAACLEYLRLRGILAWRNNTGAVRAVSPNGKARFVRFGLPGSGDIFAVLPQGRFLSVECKRPGGRLTPAQKVWQALVQKAGGVALVVTSVDELINQLREETNDH